MGSQEESIFTAVLITCFLLGSILLFFAGALVRQYKRNGSLQRKNSAAGISAMEQERSRIAADLHDEVLFHLRQVDKELMRLELKDTSEESRKLQLRGKVTHALERIREISHDLMPHDLKRKGLVESIRKLTDTIHEEYGIDIALMALQKISLSDGQTLHLFRIAQEILHNIVKHSKATEVLIVIEETNDILHFKIGDNGRGLNYDEALKQSHGFGLRSIHNRVELLGGQLFVQSEICKGLCYAIEIPLD